MDVTDLSAIFEHSPALLSRLVPVVIPSDTPERVIALAHGIIDSLEEPERIATLNAHPRIGDPVREMSELSRAEQGSDADEATLKELAALNDAYERKFGFRFVVFVAGRSKREVVPILRQRVARQKEMELATGIDEFLAIALDRLRRSRGQDRMRTP